MPLPIVLLGKNGQVGWDLQRSLAPLGLVHGTDRNSCDLADPSSLALALIKSTPQVIVNAAAYTAVDQAETDPSAAYRINTDAVAELAALAKQVNALLVHFSTDYVFDGTRNAPYTETDSIAPLSVYGRSKAAGEQAIIESGCRHLIFRTSWVYSTRGNNFAKTMLRLAAERDLLRVVDDQVGAPTSAALIADVTAHAIRDVLAGRAPGGLYHLVAAGETTWHGYANFAFEHARKQGILLKTYVAEPIPASEYPTPARRPMNSRLDTTKLREAFELTLPDWRQHVARFITDIAGIRHES
jgi:dTDP-4-dehydrorhamnose reductase